MTDHRDHELGAALLELGVPEHRPEFHRELRAALLAERAGARRRRRIELSLIGVAAAAAAIAAVVLLQRGADVANAATVQARLRTAFASMQNLGGVLVASGPAQGKTARWHFVLDDAGDARVEGPEAGDVSTYDTSTGVVRSAQHSASLGGDTLFYAERDGVAPGPPDQGPPTWILPEALGAYVRAALAASDPSVRDVTYEGRAAWQLDVATIPSSVVPGLSGDELRVTVDRQTGFPLAVVERKHGGLLRELRLEQLAVDAPLAADTFRLSFPAGADVMRSNDGFEPVTLARAAGAVGYDPFVPSWLPAGYRLSEVAVARGSGIVSLSYRRGIDQFLVTTRLRGSGAPSDPLASPPGFTDHPEPVQVAGMKAHLVLSPHTGPHVWGLTDRLVVTVGGDLGRAELTKVAVSLARG
jgi:hypothetical protein